MVAEGREFAKSIEPPTVAAAEDLHLAEYWQILRRRWKLVALCLALSMVLGAVYSLAAKPAYRATVVLDVEREGGGSIEVGPSAARGYDLEYLPTQKELIQSRGVAERVVRKLNLASNPDFLGVKTKSFLRPGAASKTTASSATQDIAAAAVSVQRHTEVLTVRGTRLLEISYVGSSPKLAADIANAIADAYIEWSLESAFQVVGQTSDFLKTQTEQVRKELEGKEQQLLAYGRQKDIVTSDPQASGTVKNLDALNADYASALADRVQKEARYYQMRTARPDAVAETLSSGLIASIRADQARLERDYAEKLNLYKPEWPAMLQMKAQIDKGRQNLEAAVQDTVSKARESARNDYMTALRREEGLKGVLRTQKTDVMANNADAVEYNNLKAQVDAKRTLLDSLLKKQSEAEVISRGNRERASNVRVVDSALPPTSRHSPSYRKNAMGSVFGGGLLGVGLAFLLSYLDRSLRTAEQVQQYLHLPTLGVIPAVSSEGRSYGYRGLSRKKSPAETEEGAIELLPHHSSRSRIAESYRAFRAALLLSRAGGVKSFVVTSTFPREGKTATSINLAVVLAQLGKRVLLVDADLHRPRLHEILRVSNRVGLVSILAENLAPDRAIVKTDVPNLFVVPSGPSSPNPSGLLASDAMSGFLEMAAVNFDYLVLDTPPVAPVADALVLGNQTDGVVLCVQGGKTPRDQVARVRDRMHLSNVRILGVLINNTTEQARGYEHAEDAYYGDGGYGSGAAPPEKRPALAASRLV
ncbi:MAG: polysaccharide biosynthesis tyrosine autokinase [Acidobacteriota bacterium]